jgi:16S rRNA (guanine527-N7)-methyltransferase
MGFTGNMARGQAAVAPLLQRLALPATLLSPLLAHASDVSAAAERLGLVSPRDAGVVIERHTADSLLFAIARAPVPGERWVDVGSGAGFPGLVLACCYPETAFTLVEPLRRRAGFLDLEIASLGLQNAEVRADRVEDLEPLYDVAVARALADPAEATARLLRCVQPGGVALVAAGHGAIAPQGASIVRVEHPGYVDSPGVLFMMSREA